MRKAFPCRQCGYVYVAPNEHCPECSQRQSSIIVGDALSLFPAVADDSVDAVMADPPYSSGGATRSDRQASTTTKYVQTGSSRTLPDFEGDARSQMGYLVWSTLWMVEALRVTRRGGWLMCFTDWRQMSTTQLAIESSGWVIRGLVTWIKPGGRPYPNRFKNNAEYIWTATRGAHPLDTKDQNADYPDGYWMGNAPTDRAHITQKPVPLMHHLMRVLKPGSTILDPFSGSGTTAQAASDMGHQFLGFEIQEEWIEYAQQRTAQLNIFSALQEGTAT